MGRDPFASAPWTPGPLGWNDCAAFSFDTAFSSEGKSEAAKKKGAIPAAPPSDVEASKKGDALLDDERMDSVAVEKFKAILADLRAQGLPVRVHEAFRTPERQKDIYASGRTDEQLEKANYKPWEIRRARRAGFTPAGTNPRPGKKPETAAPSWRAGPKGHTGGLAMDVWWVVNGKGRSAAPHAEWKKALGKAAAAHGCAWGGNWKWKYDAPHVEYFKK